MRSRKDKDEGHAVKSVRKSFHNSPYFNQAILENSTAVSQHFSVFSTLRSDRPRPSLVRYFPLCEPGHVAQCNHDSVSNVPHLPAVNYRIQSRVDICKGY